MKKLVRDYVLNGLAASPLMPRALRWRMLRLLGVDVRHVSMNPRVRLGGTDIRIGDGTFINWRCDFDTSAPITIGRNCNLAFEVVIYTSTHRIGSRNRRAGEAWAKPVTIGNGVWIGARSMVLPGVTIGDGCVIAAGAVVADDCAPDGVYAGVPARRIRSLP